MSVKPPPGSSDPAAEQRERERRRKLAEVFGDVLPDGTADDRPETWGERDGGDEDWLRGQVPPHHG